MSTVEARRRASAAFHARRTAQGARKVTLWLSPAARAILESLALKLGSKDRAADLLILAHDATSTVDHR